MIDALTIFFLVLGLLSFVTTTVGIIRFPDFYSRMHAAGKGDVFSSLTMLIGLAIYQFHHPDGAAILVAVKILMISMFIFLASPTATHAIIDAGYDAGVEPWVKEEGGEHTPPTAG